MVVSKLLHLILVSSNTHTHTKLTLLSASSSYEAPFKVHQDVQIYINVFVDCVQIKGLGLFY